MLSNWFVAELIIEITVEDDPRNVVHRNLVLIQADSAEAAYEKAQQLGGNSESSYKNPSGKQVILRFRGVSHLSIVDDPIEDGAELLFHYSVGVDENHILSLIPEKNQLRAFLPPKRALGPDYASAEVINMVEQEFGVKRPSN